MERMAIHGDIVYPHVSCRRCNDVKKTGIVAKTPKCQSAAIRAKESFLLCGRTIFTLLSPGLRRFPSADYKSNSHFSSSTGLPQLSFLLVSVILKPAFLYNILADSCALTVHKKNMGIFLFPTKVQSGI